MKEITVSDREEGQRLDKFLGKLFKEASTGFLYKMLRKKNITLNGKKAMGKELLCRGDIICVFFSETTFEKLQGLDATRKEYERLGQLPGELDIIYEDDDILVMNKPAGILSQKAAEHDVSINEQMLSYLIAQGSLPLELFACFRPSVANRLDRNTSGLMLAGKTLHGQQMLSRDLKCRRTKKRYRCVVRGEFPGNMSCQAYWKKTEADNRVEVTGQPQQGSKIIQTAFFPLQRKNGMTLMEVELLTGRSHQIRAHLSSMGYPIAGDPKYGDVEWNRQLCLSCGIRGQLLHAYSLTFADGRSFYAPEPDIFGTLMEDERRGV